MSAEVGWCVANRFRVVGGQVGEGRTGAVYPALDEATGANVVVKVLHPQLTADPAALDGLRAEAARASRLRHPHVVGVLGLWSHADANVLVSEAVAGPSLSDVLDKPLVDHAAIALVCQLADALAAAHSSGLVHGDVRAGNVLVSARGAMLYDFGVAAWLGGPSTGKAGETAPEVLNGGRPGVAADIYGLGVVLGQALTGRSLWDGPTPWAVIERQSLAAARIEAPRGLRQMVRALTHPDPTRRPGSVEVVRAALERVKEDPDASVRFRPQRFAPMRPTRAWVVHGIDPASGAPAIVRVGLSGGAARSLVEQLTQEAWKVRADKEGLSVGDLAFVTLFAIVGGLFIPVVGGVLGGMWAWWLRSRAVRPRLRHVLPICQASIPPRRLVPGTEYAVVVGVALLMTATLMSVGTSWAIVPGAVAVMLTVASWRITGRDVADEASRARVAMELEQLRLEVGTRRYDLDETLGLLGEIDELERACRTGRLDSDELLVAIAQLRVRVTAGASSPLALVSNALHAIRGADLGMDPLP
jgi:hypothetical protein